jgi:hypothetical protein
MEVGELYHAATYFPKEGVLKREWMTGALVFGCLLFVLVKVTTFYNNNWFW